LSVQLFTVGNGEEKSAKKALRREEIGQTMEMSSFSLFQRENEGYNTVTSSFLT